MKKVFPTDIDFNAGYVININKPLGWTSTDVVRKLRILLRKCGYRKIKVGHAGTLDPLATGVLLLCVGKATKSVDKLQAETKEYIADIVIGATTPSFDLEHEIDRSFPCDHITLEMIDEALQKLVGERLQTPPVYSAKKIDGQRAYEYAREGTEVAMKQALVNIYSIDILEHDHPRVRVKISCSKGTYIRSIAMELGELLQNGAYLAGLVRTRSGDNTVEGSYTMDEIEEIFKTLEQN